MDIKYGYTEVEWENAKKEIRNILIGVSKNRGLIAYFELSKKVQSIRIEHYSYALAQMLGEISTEEDAVGHEMLSAVVVHARGDMKPGEGFFELARQLGKDTSNEDKFWIRELNRVYDYWSRV